MAVKPKSLWPFSARAVVISVPLILLTLITITAITRGQIGWPSAESERLVLIGIFVLSLVPVLLAVADTLVRQGAVLEFKGIKIDFARITRATPASANVASNIGVPGEPVTDSSTTQILDTLRRAMQNEIVILDLEGGTAWWETRLLVLLAGAARSGSPKAVVFVATKAGRTGQFVGWGAPHELLPALLNVDPLYENLFDKASAAAAQWAMVEPGDVGIAPAIPGWCTGLAASYFWMAFDGSRRNGFAREQLLASELGSSSEQMGPRPVSVRRLEELFMAVLKTRFIDRGASADEQVRGFLAEDAAYIAITTDGRYEQLVQRATALAAILGSVAGDQA
jgi:hypothetical protein